MNVKGAFCEHIIAYKAATALIHRTMPQRPVFGQTGVLRIIDNRILTTITNGDFCPVRNIRADFYF